jgi:hypothetical protein
MSSGVYSAMISTEKPSSWRRSATVNPTTPAPILRRVSGLVVAAFKSSAHYDLFTHSRRWT